VNRPQVRGPEVSGTALRVVLAAAGAALVLSVVGAAPEGRLTAGSLVLGTALLTWVAASPASPAPTALLLLALVVAVDTGPASGPLLLVQGALACAVHLLAALCALGPRETRYEAAALAPSLRRWGLAQAVCAPVVLAAWLAPRGGVAGADVAAGLLGLALVAGLAALALRRRGEDRSPR
jgi:hypothetical protein